MKFRRLLILLLVMSLWGGTMMFADSAAQKVRVIVNGEDLSDAGLLSDGKTYLAVRQLANSLQSLVVWDETSKKVTVYKPNVHMFLFQDNTIFGNVNKGNRYTFKVFAQIDNLKTDVAAVKVSIFDPSGSEKVIQSQNVSLNNKDNFWYRTDDIKYNFDSSGKYAVRFFMKVNATDEWNLVSEKIITAQ
ncbi:copper amine oxidase N-terminal domain-containing protein [Paenibacillus spongiae]|uniref:Copper amine oxidase N-terminal domain-containing protein n=1 Tax=Paenibacillus spongiae TaxID=2909671 RepID=A0ABY5SFI4_9BACL|nr:copper amine oxidase N-terminal domain-containing protein [Paenibacillus spongiae]UVI32240.1 copper amine oxidase N-terminal domain-containing protein [Paenibacillus spongiae]